MGQNNSSVLTPQDRELARLSDIAYLPQNRHQEAQRIGYAYDDELSNDRVAVFRHEATGDAVIAYRGTQAPDDLSADWDIAYRGTPSDERLALDTHAKTKSKYKNVKLTGHSLGGTLAHYVSNRTDDPATIFNPGSSPLFKPTVGRHVRIIRNPNDMISQGYSGHPQTINVAHPLAMEAAPWWAQQFADHQIQQFYK